MADFEHQLGARAQTAVLAALEVVPFAMIIADGSGGALAVNAKWTELTGLARHASLGPGWLAVLDPEDRPRLREEVLRVARQGGVSSVDHQIQSGRSRRWVRFWASRHELDGTPLLAVAAADVHEDHVRQDRLFHQATHDALTGLVNRSHFLECIDQALRRAERHQRRVAVVYVDLDGFKRVNDQGGHSMGDRVLNAIASRLRHSVRAADMVARIGGDEFAVLCEGLSAADQADVVARRIALALTESVELDGERWAVAASVGAAVDQGVPDNAESLVDRADRAMYSVKLTRRPPAGETYEERGGSEFAAPYGPAPEPGVAGAPRPPDEPRRSQPAATSAGPAAPAAARYGVLDADEARRALRDLALAAGAMGPVAPDRPDPETETAYREQLPWTAGSARPVAEGPVAAATTEAPVRPDQAARARLAADVVNLRETIDSIRRMLDRMLSAESGVIDIRDP